MIEHKNGAFRHAVEKTALLKLADLADIMEKTLPKSMLVDPQTRTDIETNADHIVSQMQDRLENPDKYLERNRTYGVIQELKRRQDNYNSGKPMDYVPPPEPYIPEPDKKFSIDVGLPKNNSLTSSESYTPENWFGKNDPHETAYNQWAESLPSMMRTLGMGDQEKSDNLHFRWLDPRNFPTGQGYITSSRTAPGFNVHAETSPAAGHELAHASPYNIFGGFSGSKLQEGYPTLDALRTQIIRFVNANPQFDREHQLLNEGFANLGGLWASLQPDANPTEVFPRGLIQATSGFQSYLDNYGKKR